MTDTDWLLLILAGGLGTRHGGQDKGLLPVRGKPAVLALRERLQAPAVLVSANRHGDAYAALGLTALPDRRPGFHGPLAGLETLLQAAGERLVVVVPCDMPDLPPGLPAHLLAALADAPGDIAVVHDGDRLQPLCLAMNAACWLDDLSRYLDAGHRSVMGWLDDKPQRLCRFDDPAAFRNVNQPETSLARVLAPSQPLK